DGPALDEAGRVAMPRRARVEESVRLDAELFAACEHELDLLVRAGRRELAAFDAGNVAVLAVRAERRIDPAQPVEHADEVLVVGVLVADVDDDRHAHDLLDDGAHAL